MLRKKPETLALFVALISTLTVLGGFLADLLVTRHRDIEAGEQRLQHFGIMMAEHTARAFEAVDVTLREIATDLSGTRHTWPTWNPVSGWEYVAQRHSRAMPQLRDLMVVDANGRLRFMSTQYPPPEVSYREREDFQHLAEGHPESGLGPYVDRLNGRYSYAVGRRIEQGDKLFTGAVMATLDPGYLQDFCWPNRLSDDFEAVLINADKQIIASCRPTDLSRQSPVLGVAADKLLFAGKLHGETLDNGLSHINGLLVSVAPVPGFPDLRILTVIPEGTLLASWRSRLIELGVLGLLVSLVLLVGALLVRRQLRDMAGMTEALAASHENLAERVREATQELAAQKDEAERANTAKSRFLAAASHDLRQPLHALSLFATDLLRQLRGGTAHELPRLAEQIASSTSLLGELLDSLLDISRLDVAGIKPDIRPFPLGPCLDRLASSCRRAAVDRKLKLRIRPSRQWVESDAVMLERIIANLLSNALRYTPPGGRILVGARRRGDTIRIEVRDSGMGIAPEHQAAIFAEFYQVGNSAREQNKGLGLGLSIVDRLTRALGIRVDLRSRLGEGTTFALEVKASRALANNPSEPPVPRAGQVHLVGNSEDIAHCAQLIASWQYTVSRDTASPPGHLPNDSIIVCPAELATELAARLAPGAPLVALLGSTVTSLPPGAHGLQAPIRPARLRALLAQLQKTLAKSIP